LLADLAQKEVTLTNKCAAVNVVGSAEGQKRRAW